MSSNVIEVESKVAVRVVETGVASARKPKYVDSRDNIFERQFFN